MHRYEDSILPRVNKTNNDARGFPARALLGKSITKSITMASQPDALPLSILVITSPSPSNPSTFLMEHCIGSMQSCIPDLSLSTPLIIVLDGYNLCREGQSKMGPSAWDVKLHRMTTSSNHAGSRLKRGRITSDMVEPYQAYQHAVEEWCKLKGFVDWRVERLATHHGELTINTL